MNRIIRESLFESSNSNNFGCVMLYAESPDWPKFVRRVVKEEDIYESQGDDYGYEDDAHLTVLFGIHDDEVKHEQIFDVIRNIPELRIGIQEIGIFENDEYDVVKLNVPRQKYLLDLHERFKEFPHTLTFKDYNPHMTIAYVQKGKGKKYVGQLPRPINFKFNKGTYSEPNYRKSYFDLKNAYKNYNK